ncbi:tetratricopeptide repeat protein [Mucilaginibacter lutimaris]|uniref:Tetratricopeptide repeat protein n=1 Tax=Mucilaginibacter lutimaris TaxID=931629 RepID=A0ABW2Z9R5_9SPHI
MPQGLLTMLALWLIFFTPAPGYAINQQQKPIYKANMFVSLKDTAMNRRVQAARAMYKVCRKMTEADAMHAVDDLVRISDDLSDMPLMCATYDFRADYYSVNRGYNELSNKYFDQAIALAQNKKMQLEAGIYQHRKANYYFLYKKNTEACRYYLLSEENFREVGFDKVPGMGNLFSETANFYYSLGEFENARQNLKQALKYNPEVSRTRINIFNTIGLTYRNDGQYEKALPYFNLALNMARNTKDTIWIGIATGNIGSVYFMQHQYAKALPLIREDYNTSLKYDEKQNSAIAMLRLVRINVDQGKLKEAALQLDTINNTLDKCTEDVLGQKVLYYELRSIIAERNDNVREAIQYRDRSDKLREIIAKRDNIAAIERIRLQWVTQKSREEFNNLKKSSQIDTFKLTSVIVLLVLSLIIIALIYNRRIYKAQKEQQLLASEKRRVDEELKNATLALNGYTENLTQKNLLIEEIKAELENIQSKNSVSEVAANLDKMMQAHIMTEDNWEEFKKLFSKVHNTFFYNLRQAYDNLSGTDVRLLALIKLKLNNREIAGMLGITVDGVKKAKQRLRKKMGLLKEEDFEKIINKL